MKILVQVGNLGSSVMDHLISPIAQVTNVQKILIFCHSPGTAIPNVEYHCPPKFLRGFPLGALVYEFFNLFFMAIFSHPTHLAGYKLFPHGLIAFMAGKITRKPVIISLISGPVDLFSIGSPIGVNYQKPLPMVGRLLVNVLENSDSIITTGSFTRDFLIKHGIQESKIYPIIHPANKSRFYRVDIPKVYDIISVGRLAPLKHIEIVARGVAKIKENYPDIKACIVGDGPCKAEIIELANELGIKENIDFVGWQNDVLDYYNRAKIFIHTSEREGFPNVVLEAMLCGLPCVISNCGDITDIAKDGFNSVVIPKFDDYEGFARAVIHLLEDKELYGTLAKNAIKTMESLSVENVSHRWQTILVNGN